MGTEKVWGRNDERGGGDNKYFVSKILMRLNKSFYFGNIESNNTKWRIKRNGTMLKNLK